jgi:hypothetical protein
MNIFTVNSEICYRLACELNFTLSSDIDNLKSLILISLLSDTEYNYYSIICSFFDCR